MTKCFKSDRGEIEEAQRVHEENEPRCRGPDSWWAWLVCGASAISVAIILGIIYSFGLLLPPLMETFDETRQTTGIAIANRTFGNRTQSVRQSEQIQQRSLDEFDFRTNRTQPSKSNRSELNPSYRLCLIVFDYIRFAAELNRTATADYVRLCSVNKFA